MMGSSGTFRVPSARIVIFSAITAQVTGDPIAPTGRRPGTR
jgi:hypothetical protein